MESVFYSDQKSGSNIDCKYLTHFLFINFLFIFQAVKENLGRAIKDKSLKVEFEHNEMVVEPCYEEGWEIVPLYHLSVSRCRFCTLEDSRKNA